MAFDLSMLVCGGPGNFALADIFFAAVIVKDHDALCLPLRSGRFDAI